MAGTGGRNTATLGIDRHRVLLAGSSSLETPAERALDRVLRSGHPASVLRLYLSHLQPPSFLLPPGPRPHHGRVARCLFDDAVQHGGGQVFGCRNGDLVLIAGPDAVAALGATLLPLFRAEAQNDRQVIGIWSLPEEAAAVRAEFAASTADAMIAEDPPAPLGAIAAIGALLASTQFDEFLRRQTAIRITGTRIAALFQEVSVSVAAIEARIGLNIPPDADPYLTRYLTAQLDARLTSALPDAKLLTAPAINVNLPLATIRSPGFEALRLAAQRQGVLLGVELALADAVANLPLYEATRRHLQAEACSVVLDGIDHRTLLHCDPAALQPDLLKLDWSPLLPTLPAHEQRRIRQALDALGPERVVLNQANAEAALVWGRERGIACFQGRHVDLMLAADRIRGCAHSAACTLRQCIERAAANDERGQLGCQDTDILGGRLHWWRSPTQGASA